MISQGNHHRMRRQPLPNALHGGEKSPKDELAALLIEEERQFPQEIAPPSPPAQTPVNPAEQTAVVSAGTVFEGDLHTEGHLQVQGRLKGDAKAGGNIVVSGEIEGNVFGNCISLEGCAVRGDVCAEGELVIGEGAVISGALRGKSVAVGGKVRGNINAEKAVVLRGESLVLGDVTGQLITMQEGAALFGAVNVLSREQDKLAASDFDRFLNEKTSPADR